MLARRRSAECGLLCTFILVVTLSASLAALTPAALYAEAAVRVDTPTRRPEFRVPQGIRGRVDFWINVFARYGQAEVVMHHREYPQATFGVLDLSKEYAELPPIAFERFKKKAVRDATAEINSILEQFARGQQPQTIREQQIWDAMELVPGDVQKFRRAIKEEWVRSQTGIREKYADAMARSGRYLPYIERIFVQDFGLPLELTRLPFIESSFDYRAYSSVGAAGIWQFMRSTGKVYGLAVNNAIDERRDVFEATRAAAQYLKNAYSDLGSWPLAITSYNHGVAGVARKVKQLGTTNIVEIVEHPSERIFGFASMNFFPEFLAALDVYDGRARYFPNLQIESPPAITEYRLPRPMSVAHIMRNTGVDAETLRSLNYAISERVWKGVYHIPAGYTLKLPAAVSSYVARLHAPESGASLVVAPAASSVYGGIVYKVRKGDTLSKIARHYNTSVSTLRSLNELSSDGVRIGQVLIIRPRESGPAPGVEKSRETARSSSPSSKPSTTSALTYKVRSGDSLWGIARRHGVSVEALKRANKLTGKGIHPGQKLSIPAH